MTVHAPTLNVEDVGPGPYLDDKEVFLGSIAISLKRIADALEGQQFTANLQDAIVNGINMAAQDWIGHMARNGR